MLQTSIRTGELDRQITFIQKVTEEAITNESLTTSWEEIDSYATTWARKKELPGNESLIADRPTYTQRTIFTIRYRTDLNVQMRCVCDDRVYEILSITENGTTRKKFLDVMANLLDTETWVAATLGAFTIGFSPGFNIG